MQKPRRNNSAASASIAGTWNDFQPMAMTRCKASEWTYSVTIGGNGWESFQILLHGTWDSAIYPSIKNAAPHAKYSIRGPDTKGHGRNWTIGCPPKEPHGFSKLRIQASAGEIYKVILSLDENGLPANVTWKCTPEELGKQSSASAVPGSDSRPKVPLPSRQDKPESAKLMTAAGQWLAAESTRDMTIGDIVLPGQGDIIVGNKGLAERGGEMLSIEFVEHCNQSEWIENAIMLSEETYAAVAEQQYVSIKVWRLPEARGWSPKAAITMKQPTCCVTVRMQPRQTMAELVEELRAGLPCTVAVYDGNSGNEFSHAALLQDLVQSKTKLVYELWTEVKVYDVSASSSDASKTVVVKSSATFYDVKVAVIRKFYYMYCDITLVTEFEDGSVVPCDEDARLDGCTSVGCIGELVEAFEALASNEVVRGVLLQGAHMCKYVDCRIEGTFDDGGHYDIHVLPTERYDRAVGLSDKYIAHVPRGYLCKRSQTLPAWAFNKCLNKKELTDVHVLQMMTELRDAYRSSHFSQLVSDLQRRFTDHIGYLSKFKEFTAFYTMRKQALLSIQRMILPKYGFSPFTGGAGEMISFVTAGKFVNRNIYILSNECNQLVEALYQDPDEPLVMPAPKGF